MLFRKNSVGRDIDDPPSSAAAACNTSLLHCLVTSLFILWPERNFSEARPHLNPLQRFPAPPGDKNSNRVGPWPVESDCECSMSSHRPVEARWFDVLFVRVSQPCNSPTVLNTGSVHETFRVSICFSHASNVNFQSVLPPTYYPTSTIYSSF